MASRAHACGVARYLSLTHQEIPGPFDGLVGMVRRYFRLQGVPDDQRRSVIRSRLAVAEEDPILDSLQALLSNEHTYRVGDRAVLTLKTARQRYIAVAQFLEKLAADRPIILLADDVHWSLATIECLTFLVEERAALACCIFSTARRQIPRGVTKALALALDHASNIDRGGHIKLGPLGRSSLAELIQSRLRLSGDTLETLLDRADGNPLYAEQLVQHLLNRDRLESTEQGFVNRRSTQRTMPLALESLWQQRLDEALFHRDAFREMVEVAATFGRTVAIEEWRAACQIVGVDESRTILARLEGAELIRIDPGQGRFTFAH
ncbi:MAG: hypothetical protein VYD85_00875, partial [Pseudomonadota bacterium]|nr:hypothetical protein [Pseudomonadota bacterium]